MSQQSNMATTPPGDNLKQRFLKLLDEDEEFRQLVITKLGLKNIFDSLKQLHKNFKQHQEEMKQLFARLDEHD